MKHIWGPQCSQPVAVGASHRHFLARSRYSHLHSTVESSKRATSRQWLVYCDGFAAVAPLQHLELDIIDLAPRIPSNHLSLNLGAIYLQLPNSCHLSESAPLASALTSADRSPRHSYHLHGWTLVGPGQQLAGSKTLNFACTIEHFSAFWHRCPSSSSFQLVQAPRPPAAVSVAHLHSQPTSSICRRHRCLYM